MLGLAEASRAFGAFAAEFPQKPVRVMIALPAGRLHHSGRDGSGTADQRAPDSMRSDPFDAFAPIASVVAVNLRAGDQFRVMELARKRRNQIAD